MTEVIIGISFFALGYFATRLRRNRKIKPDILKNKDHARLVKKLEPKLAGRIVDFYGRTYAKDIKNRCYVVILRDTHPYAKKHNDYLMDMCLAWSHHIVDIFKVHRDVLDVGNALLIFNNYVKHSDEFRKTPLGSLECYEDVRNYFFDLMAVEVSRAINEDNSIYASKIHEYVEEIALESKEDDLSEHFLKANNYDFEM